MVLLNYLAVLAIVLSSYLSFTPLVTASDTELKVHYIQPQTEGLVSRACKTKACARLLQRINTAKHSVDFALYGVRGQDQIIEALVAAKERGVGVRGIVDRTLDGKNYYFDTEKLIRLVGSVKDDQAADRKIHDTRKKFNWKPTCSRPRGFNGPLQCLGYEIDNDTCLLAAHASRGKFPYNAIMHHKFFIIDARWVWTGSANLSDTGTGGYNANAVVEVNSSKVAQMYQREFEQMYVDGNFHTLKKRTKNKSKVLLNDKTRLEILFSPQQKPMRRVIKLISKAKDSIDIAIFFLTHKEVTRQLIKAHRRGVVIRIILDATAAKNGYTKHEILRRAGVPVKVENWGGKMHMKAASIDSNTLILGSMNWTSAGAYDNDENTIIVGSRRHAKAFEDNFNKLWTSIADRWLHENADPESRMSIGSCIDKIDNDFDKNVDAVDPGCSSNPPALPKLPPFQIAPKKKGYDLVKGNISKKGAKIYHVVGGGFYDKTVINTWLGEKWFCSTFDAKEAGWRRSKR